MVENQLQFDQRLRRLTKKHRAMAQGYTTRMRPDGLIVVKPRKTKSRVSFRSVLLFVAAFFLFKGFLFATLGPETYDERVGRLQQGSMIEQAGAFVMQGDPVTNFIASKLGPILR
jgi:hypothetical protein